MRIFGAIKDIATQTLTGKDGQTHDIARHSWAIGIFSVVSGAAWNAWNGATVNLTELAGALGLVSGASAISVKAKETAEPDAK